MRPATRTPAARRVLLRRVVIRKVIVDVRPEHDDDGAARAVHVAIPVPATRCGPAPAARRRLRPAPPARRS